jgi:3-hydroxyisobutyrate dehydrogenase-like beta-hydroxyacid dehydrogenase
MNITNVGILHPGQMGISIAASAANGGSNVYWASENRSAQTRTRAAEHELLDAVTLPQICNECQALISVCPPHAAEDLARGVIAQGFRGLYVDANAISPQRAKRIGRMIEDSGAHFVDGGIVGGPAWQPNSTWLHLSGERAAQAAALFSAGPLETNILSANIGDASALKMCFAAYTKGRTALLCAILGAAESYGVREALAQQWDDIGFDLAKTAPKRARQVTAKAWRFAGEMDEIAAALEAAGQPPGFHQAAGDIYRRLAHFKDAPQIPSLQVVLSALQETERVDPKGFS